MLYPDRMLEQGLINPIEHKTICEYLDKTDMIITYKDNKFYACDREITLIYNSVNELMKDVNTNLFYINEQIKHFKKANKKEERIIL